MPRLLTVAAHLPIAELEHRSRACRDPVERGHWQMVWLVAQGHTCPTVARLVGYSEKWVCTVLHRYTDDGPAGITDRRHANPGQPPRLTPALQEDLRRAAGRGGVWTSRTVAAWMVERLGRRSARCAVGRRYARSGTRPCGPAPGRPPPTRSRRRRRQKRAR